MRHNAAGRKLGRKTGHRLAMFRNQLASLVASERIVTTVAKAKELRPLAERMITQGKRGTVHARRLVGRWVPDRGLVKKLFDEIAPRFASRSGGYLRIVKLGSRQGDGAEMAILEFVDFQLKSSAARSAVDSGKAKKKGRKAAGASETTEAAGAEGSPEIAAGAEQTGSKRKAAGKAKTSTKVAKPSAKKAAGKDAPKSKPSVRSPAAKKTSTQKKIGGS